MATSLQISYHAERFPDPSHNTKKSGVPSWLGLNWNELVHAAMTIGRPGWTDVLKHGSASIHEIIFRINLLKMALEQDSSGVGTLQRTSAYKRLDPSEKGAVNYFLGMTACKLFADKVLGIPWVMHLDVFKDQLDPDTLGQKSRPDLVGQRIQTGEWVAFECKGRASPPGPKEKKRAKKQAQRLVSVQSKPCALNVGAISYFDKNQFKFYWCDPATDGEGPIELSDAISRMRSNYAVFEELTNAEGLTLHDFARERTSVQIPDIDVRIGLRPDVAKRLLEDDFEGVVEQLRETPPQTALKDVYMSTGISVVCGPSWWNRSDLDGE